MAEQIDTERRLVAILAADIEGYSRLMGADEVGTLQALTKRRAILDGLISAHRGRIANTAGDSVLAEFGSAVDAVQCAVEAQTALAEANAGLSPNRQINFRIGVHVGDVMVKGGDLFGDGVNIAARLQSFASPGGTCISGAAHDQVRKILPLAFADLGAQQLKNIEEPVRAFAVTARGAVAALYPAGSPTVPSDSNKHLPLPDKPSIAVLPFQSMGDDPEQEYFADGMVEEIITALSRFKSLFVIACNSSFTYKGKAVDIKQVGRELGVRYVLEGSVRKAAGKVRITGQLIEVANGAHLWADKFDGAIEDAFDLQDKVTTQVVGAIFPRLEEAEFERARRKPPENHNAYELFARATAVYYPPTPEASFEQLGLLNQALELDPEFAVAHAAAARCYAWRRTNDWMVDRQTECAAGARHSWSAAEFGKDDALPLAWAAYALAAITGDVEDAAAFADRATYLNPNLVPSWLASGWVRAWRGDHKTAIEHFKTGMRLSPRDPRLVGLQGGISLAHYCAKEYAEALAHAEAAQRTNLQRHGPTSVRIRAASLAMLGRDEEAAGAMTKLLQLDPQRRLANLRDSTGPLRPADFAQYLEGLRRAGLPE